SRVSRARRDGRQSRRHWTQRRKGPLSGAEASRRGIRRLRRGLRRPLGFGNTDNGGRRGRAFRPAGYPGQHGRSAAGGNARDATETNFDYVLDVNLKGTMFQAQAAAAHMIRQGTGGKQVHFGSVRSQLALRGRGFAAYCAAKGGMGTLCKQLAAEWAQ